MTVFLKDGREEKKTSPGLQDERKEKIYIQSIYLVVGSVSSRFYICVRVYSASVQQQQQQQQGWPNRLMKRFIEESRRGRGKDGSTLKKKKKEWVVEQH